MKEISNAPSYRMLASGAAFTTTLVKAFLSFLSLTSTEESSHSFYSLSQLMKISPEMFSHSPPWPFFQSSGWNENKAKQTGFRSPKKQQHLRGNSSLMLMQTLLGQSS